MGRHVTYYDCSNWISTVEVMNVTGKSGYYAIQVWDRDGSFVWGDSRRLNPHQTERIPLNEYAKGKEGLVMVNSYAGPDSSPDLDEVAAVLVICDEGRDWREGNRFVPFTPI